MTKQKMAKKAVRRARSPGSVETRLPRELVAHQAGGHPALDFCNTAGEHLARRPEELLRDWESFLRWAAQVGLIEPESYFELLRHPEPLIPIIELREAIYRVGLAAARNRRIPEGDVAFIREYANARLPEIGLRNNAARWRPAPSFAAQQLCAVLAGEALSLFCSPRAARIGLCEGDLCGWLFIDESRGKRRRWCDMKDCGSRAKARRFYEKHKAS
jgi:predicted RNA-binding Zn ribbon-like protein